jgi:tetratricopeptide (TPR) repeat protein
MWTRGTAFVCCTIIITTIELTASPGWALSPDWTQCLNRDDTFSNEIAIEACSAILRGDNVSRDNSAIAYSSRAHAWSAKGDKDRAIADYGEAIRLDPEHAIAYNNRGLAWAAKGDKDRAIADYDEAIRLNPQFVLAYNNRGNAWLDKGDNDRAIADYDEAIRLNPKYINAYNNRGNARSAKSDNDRAIADYDEAIRLNPKFADAYNNRGLSWSAKGDIDRAIADYDEAIRLNPKFAIAYNSRALSWSTKADNDRATADYDEAIRLNPKYANAYSNRGRWYFYKGDFNAAAADLLRGSDLKDNAYTMLWRYLARAHLRQDGAAELSANAARLTTKDWPYAVIDFYLGRRTLDEMRAAANNANNKCEASFFAGEWQLLQGNTTDAKASLQIARDTCPKTFAEYRSAVAELKRLQ